jgi:hypothetical protein
VSASLRIHTLEAWIELAAESPLARPDAVPALRARPALSVRAELVDTAARTEVLALAACSLHAELPAASAYMTARARAAYREASAFRAEQTPPLRTA